MKKLLKMYSPCTLLNVFKYFLILIIFRKLKDILNEECLSMLKNEILLRKTYINEVFFVYFVYIKIHT